MVILDKSVIQRLQVRFLREDHIFALLVLSSCRSGGSSLPPKAFALVAYRPEARKTIEQKIKARSTLGRKIVGVRAYPWFALK